MVQLAPSKDSRTDWLAYEIHTKVGEKSDWWVNGRMVDSQAQDRGSGWEYLSTHFGPSRDWAQHGQDQQGAQQDLNQFFKNQDESIR